jgi:transloator
MAAITKTTTGPLQGLTPTTEVTEGEPTTASGIGGQSGKVPDAGDGGLTLGLTMALLSFLPTNLGSDFETRLAEVTDKLKSTTGDAEKSRVTNEMETKRLNIEENQQRMEDAQTKMDEAEVKAESGAVWDKISIAFMALGAVLMAALGAVLIATGVGAVAGALMIAGAALMLVSVVNSLTQQLSEDGLGIAGSIAKASGAESDVISDADMGFGISLAIATAVVAIAATVVSAGAAGPALVGAVQSLLSAAGSVASTAGAVSGAVSAGYKMDATFDRADATEKRAAAQDTEAFMQQLDDLVDQAMQMLMAANERFNAIVDSVTEMVQDTGNTLSNTRFAG